MEKSELNTLGWVFMTLGWFSFAFEAYFAAIFVFSIATGIFIYNIVTD